MIYIGTSAWAIPSLTQASFPNEGSHLERYSQILKTVEINSSFHKFHSEKTYEKWRLSTPNDFKFSVKLNKYFTHECNLSPSIKELNKELSTISHLENKWAVLLLQFPGSMNFNAKKMERFYKIIRKKFHGSIAIEPRNISWVNQEAVLLMKEFKISKVIADPERFLSKDYSFSGIRYYRLHGSPVVYKSSYSEEFLSSLADKIIRSKKENWVIFDNSMFGYATKNALMLKESIG